LSLSLLDQLVNLILRQVLSVPRPLNIVIIAFYAASRDLQIHFLGAGFFQLTNIGAYAPATFKFDRNGCGHPASCPKTISRPSRGASWPCGLDKSLVRLITSTAHSAGQFRIKKPR